jgi:hypothetical protein
MVGSVGIAPTEPLQRQIYSLDRLFNGITTLLKLSSTLPVSHHSLDQVSFLSPSSPEFPEGQVSHLFSAGFTNCYIPITVSPTTSGLMVAEKVVAGEGFEPSISWL